MLAWPAVNRRTLGAIALVTGIAVAAWIAWPRRAMSDEDRIRAAIDAMASAAEKRDIGGILEHVSERYRGEGGGRDELRGYLFGYLRRAEFVAVVVRAPRIERRGDEADASFRVIFTRVQAGAEVREGDIASAGAHAIDARFVREDGRWRVDRATRREIGFAEAILDPTGRP